MQKLKLALGLLSATLLFSCSNKEVSINHHSNYGYDVSKYLKSTVVQAEYVIPKECRSLYREEQYGIAILPIEVKEEGHKGIFVDGFISSSGYEQVIRWVKDKYGLRDNLRISFYKEMSKRYPYVVYADDVNFALKKETRIAIKPEVRIVKIEKVDEPDGSYVKARIGIFFKMINIKTGRLDDAFMSIGEHRSNKFLYDSEVNWSELIFDASRKAMDKAIKKIEIILPRVAKVIEVRKKDGDRFAFIMGKGIRKGNIYVPVDFKVMEVSGDRVCVPNLLDARVKVKVPVTSNQGWTDIEGRDKDLIVEGMLLRYLP